MMIHVANANKKTKDKNIIFVHYIVRNADGHISKIKLFLRKKVTNSSSAIKYSYRLIE